MQNAGRKKRYDVDELNVAFKTKGMGLKVVMIKSKEA